MLDGAGPRAERLLELFRGAEERHGTYTKRLRLVGQKMEMKDEDGKGPLDVRGPPTAELWERHLAGASPLGISPVREDGMCRWGVIDVDDYAGLDHAGLVRDIGRLGLPLVCARSKSGGAHLLTFASDWMPQSEMNQRLRDWAGRLGHGDAEVYPPASGSGNWLNMPYLGDDESIRCGIKENGMGMAVAEFLAAAERVRQMPQRVAQGRARRLLAEYSADISACSAGGRAKLVYGRAKDMGRLVGKGEIEEDEAQATLLDAAVACGLGASEALGHIRNGLKDGAAEPDAPSASNRSRIPILQRIVILTGGDERLWRVTVQDHGDITLPPKEVLHFFSFKVRCAEELQVVFSQPKEAEWVERVDDALQFAEEEALPRDETVSGAFHDLLTAFCNDRYRAESLDEVLLGKPFVDDNDGRTYFRFADLMAHLQSSRDGGFKAMSRHAVGRLLKATGAEGADHGKTTKPLKGRVTELRWVRTSLLERPVELPLPRVENSTI
ncbi:hypothetical protein FVA81_04155 [Rhizobium sp. WL3]|uniref:hypothetical protein n=1 Tax=Rhizobium sp. WL3 TaxID=2603277 RepID=UPI0011C1DEFE|nr:hypothetical protein [Rhizobium sp. WL3]QEE43852.1 hypothetical protein FVA81_04155 [Rhizobium sp. WL3]